MKQEKAESILDTARSLFAKYGIRKTSLQDVAGMARVAKATIYNYFGSKDQVYIEVLNREANRSIEKISAAVGLAASPVDKLKAFLDVKFHLMKEAVNILNLGREGTDKLPPKTGEIRNRLFSREVSILHSILENGVKEGIFHNTNIVQTARGIGYALRGFEATLLREKNDSEIREHLNGMFNILCKGMLTRKGVS
jgi:AcrR family transcriptional regulator